MASKSIVVFLFLAVIASSVIAQAPGPSPTRSPLPATPPISQPPRTAAPTTSRASTPPPSVTPTAAPTSPPVGSPTSTVASPPAPPTSVTPDGAPAANAPSGPTESTPANENNAAALSAGSFTGFVFVATLLLLSGVLNWFVTDFLFIFGRFVFLFIIENSRF
ncbi:hypothetical protein F2Q70_00003081 [Brassica cretica]|uniref:Arabinogalactan protein n=1 Tax=Brassica cretica TaxID=69181 RepID=A0A8S9J2I5_BRACR|nr:hypothetical protein F2Q70_00003081 [Brassica cretica]